MPTQYECPKCKATYLSDGWCPEDGEKLEATLVESIFPLSTESLHFDPSDDASYDAWVESLIKNKR